MSGTRQWILIKDDIILFNPDASIFNKNGVLRILLPFLNGSESDSLQGRDLKSDRPMVLILDSNSEEGAHVQGSLFFDLVKARYPVSEWIFS